MVGGFGRPQHVPPLSPLSSAIFPPRLSTLACLFALSVPDSPPPTQFPPLNEKARMANAL